jgi:CRISPR system Cascade subunit CasA
MMKDWVCYQAAIRRNMALTLTFNLITEKWIKVRSGSTVDEVSLLDALVRAHEFDSLSGELPTMDAAFLRLLLAVLYAIFTRVDECGRERELDSSSDAVEFWHTLWRFGRFPDDVVKGYFTEFSDRFDLFDSSRPFYQVAGLHTTNRGRGGKPKDDKIIVDGDEVSKISQIIAHVPSRASRRFFTEVNGSETELLTFAQAARWLVHLQAWDYAGKKASIDGGDPNKGGPGWCGKLGIVFSVGNTLFETLMLNFVLKFNKDILNFGIPSWESDEPSSAAKKNIEPGSYLELLTLQSRRVRLFADGDKVIGVLSSYGDVFDKENRFVEQMSGWHLSSQKGQGWIPNTHEVGHSMWRDLDSLLPQYVETNNNTSSTVRRPGILDWLAEVGFDTSVKISAIGYKFDPMMTTVKEMISDSLTVNAQLFAELGKMWTDKILEILKETDKAVVDALGRLANDLEKSAGNRDTKASARAKEQAYFALDEPFREWLAKINPQNKDYKSVNDAEKYWYTKAKGILLNLGKELVQEAGDAAFAGRELKDDKIKGGYINSAIALGRFQGSLKKIVGGGENR